MDVFAKNEFSKIISQKYLMAKEKFCTFDDFCEYFQLDDDIYEINLLNLTFVSNNSRSKELWDLIHELDEDIEKLKYGNEFRKEIREFRALAFFLFLYPYFRFMKFDGPDFILQDGARRIGLEITSAVSVTDAIINKITRDNFGRGKSFEEVAKDTSEKHPRFKKESYLFDQNGVSALLSSVETSNCEYFRNMLLQAALIKNKKAKKYTPFHELWIIIDTVDHVCFTGEYDAIKLSKLLIKEKDEMSRIDKIFVINIINKICMAHDVERQEFKFLEC